MICDNCMWSLAEELEFCKNHKDPNNCDRFYSAEVEKKDDLICDVCGKDKDPGSCWWCGN